MQRYIIFISFLLPYSKILEFEDISKENYDWGLHHFQIIYVTRNPRDACVSYHNHWKILEGYHGGFEQFADAFISDIAGYYSPFIYHVLGIISDIFVSIYIKNVII